jgi:hypothetical protein
MESPLGGLRQRFLGYSLATLLAVTAPAQTLKPEVFIPLNESAIDSPIVLRSESEATVNACYECLGAVVGCTQLSLPKQRSTPVDGLSRIIAATKQDCTMPVSKMSTTSTGGSTVSVPLTSDVVIPGMVTISRVLSGETPKEPGAGGTVKLQLYNRTEGLNAIETQFTFPEGIDYHRATLGPAAAGSTLADAGEAGIFGAKLLLNNLEHQITPGLIANLEVYIDESLAGKTVQLGLRNTTGFTADGAEKDVTLSLEPHELRFSPDRPIVAQDKLTVSAAYSLAWTRENSKEACDDPELEVFNSRILLRPNESTRFEATSPSMVFMLMGTAAQSTVLAELYANEKLDRKSYFTLLDPFGGTVGSTLHASTLFYPRDKPLASRLHSVEPYENQTYSVLEYLEMWGNGTTVDIKVQSGLLRVYTRSGPRPPRPSTCYKTIVTQN